MTLDTSSTTATASTARATWLSRVAEAEGAPSEIQTLAEQRRQARADHDFSTADRLRDEIATRGWEVRDVAGGFELVPR